MSIEKIQTQEEIEDLYETDYAFNEESTSETLGRLAWLVERQRAEFLIFLSEIGLSESQIADISSAFQASQVDFVEFVAHGIGLEKDDPDSDDVDSHPLQEVFEELTQKAMHGIEDVAYDEAEAVDEDLDAFGYNFNMLQLMSDEAIIHRLQHISDKYPAS